MKNNKVTIIAEAGVNHNGNLENAYKLIDVASDAKVDFIKFQTFIAEENISKHAKKAEYQIKNSKEKNESQLEMVKKLELSQSDHLELINYCKVKNINFSSTAFDFPSINFLHSLNLDFFKIPSGEITNYTYLVKVSKLFSNFILSTGMASLEEIREALNILIDNGANKDKITVLHCNTEYPTPMKDVNLKAMNTISEELGVKVGYSDHTLGIEVPIAAVAMGATVIEKHFTLDRNMEGPDHAASLEPNELKDMVHAIRNIELAISGNGKKEPSESELKNKPIARKSIVAAKEIKKGEVFTEDNLTVKRPGTGISPMIWEEVIGKQAIKDFLEDELITL